jgi:hypothetical protein
MEPAPFRETMIRYCHDMTHDELSDVVYALLDHLKLNLIRTNQTKHGDTQLILEPDEDEL